MFGLLPTLFSIPPAFCVQVDLTLPILLSPQLKTKPQQDGTNSKKNSFISQHFTFFSQFVMKMFWPYGLRQHTTCSGPSHVINKKTCSRWIQFLSNLANFGQAILSLIGKKSQKKQSLLFSTNDFVEWRYKRRLNFSENCNPLYCHLRLSWNQSSHITLSVPVPME